MDIGSSTAFLVFVNYLQHLEKKQDDTKWKSYETKGDAWLKNKGRYGMYPGKVWFVVETKEKQDVLG